ncbi:GL24983 [Drosophila persimilis]|uniref:GL24983 n=1 Tax=Drosophila persimilis TaxID=7234 RepID=B4GRA6_DROPE|nr:uncharacterized protein LOC6596158 [Drosophila persimilis]EDW40291.1 GL24983 [Drosophila persimilis]
MEKITLFALICLIGTAVATPMGFTHATTSPKQAGTAPGVVHWTTGVQTKGSTALNQTKTTTNGKPTVQAVKVTATTAALPAVHNSSAVQGSTTTVDTTLPAASDTKTQAPNEATTPPPAHSEETVTTTEAATTVAVTEQIIPKEAQSAKQKQRKAKKFV